MSFALGRSEPAARQSGDSILFRILEEEKQLGRTNRE